MYSLYMRPPSLSYRCRMCGAASYRRLVHRGTEGAMVYSGLYRCSGCSLTFSDPPVWRETPAADESTALTECVPPDSVLPAADVPIRDSNPSGWGITLPRLGQPLGIGYSDEDLKGIHEAVAGANKSKAKGRRG